MKLIMQRKNNVYTISIPQLGRAGKAQAGEIGAVSRMTEVFGRAIGIFGENGENAEIHCNQAQFAIV